MLYSSLPFAFVQVEECGLVLPSQPDTLDAANLRHQGSATFRELVGVGTSREEFAQKE